MIHYGTLDFGGGTLGAGAQPTVSFMVKLDAAGRHVWSRVLGGSGSVEIRGLAASPRGAAVVTGGLEGAIGLPTGMVLGNVGSVFVSTVGP